MREFVKISSKKTILDTLNDFSDVFPHMCEKIESMEAYAEKLSKYANFYVGTEDGRVFGIAVFYANDIKTKTAYISLIGLKDGVRGKGFGKWLLERCEEKSRESGMTGISLEVDCDNRSAISFYERNNFVIGKETDRNSMYMHKCLGE